MNGPGTPLSHPGAFPVGEEEFIRLRYLSINTNAILQLSYIVLLPDGTKSFNKFDVVLTTDGDDHSAFFGLPQGTLLSVYVATKSTSLSPQQTHVMLALQRNNLTSKQPYVVLAAGYLNPILGITWPGSGIEGNLSGPGDRQSVVVASPAAGATKTFQIAAFAEFEWLSLIFTLAASAAAANREVAVELSGDGAVKGMWPSTIIQTANQTVTYTFSGQGANLQGVTALSTHAVAFPHRLRAAQGDEIKINVGSIQAADQLSAIQFSYRQWLLPT